MMHILGKGNPRQTPDTDIRKWKRTGNAEGQTRKQTVTVGGLEAGARVRVERTWPCTGYDGERSARGPAALPGIEPQNNPRASVSSREHAAETERKSRRIKIESTALFKTELRGFWAEFTSFSTYVGIHFSHTCWTYQNPPWL